MPKRRWTTTGPWAQKILVPVPTRGCDLDHEQEKTVEATLCRPTKDRTKKLMRDGWLKRLFQHKTKVCQTENNGNAKDDTGNHHRKNREKTHCKKRKRNTYRRRKWGICKPRVEIQLGRCPPSRTKLLFYSIRGRQYPFKNRRRGRNTL